MTKRKCRLCRLKLWNQNEKGTGCCDDCRELLNVLSPKGQALAELIVRICDARESSERKH
jgi:hypothetical protein